MISVKQAIEIHEIVVKAFGGSMGVRDLGALESAMARPFQTFGGEDLYPDFFTKAAAIAESIIINHPFIDGNKRTGYGLLRIYLGLYGYEISASTDNRYELIINIASGTLKFDGIVEWLRKHTKNL